MGFNPRLAPQTVSHVWTHDPAADEVFSLFRFPAVGVVVGAYATNTATQVVNAGTPPPQPAYEAVLVVPS